MNQHLNQHLNQHTAGEQTVVATPRWMQVLIWLGLVALLAGAGWLLQALAGWIASLPWAPFQGVFERVDRLPEPVATVGALLVGGAAGLVLAHLASRESRSVRVGTEAATISWNGRHHTVPRTEVETVFLDRRELVVLGRTGRELAREPSDQDTDRLAAAFRAHGYPWRDGGDPHQHAYRRWVPDLPGLPPGADPLLKARHRALEQDHPAEARELRTDLGQLGVLVRDEAKRQYVRRTGVEPEPEQ